jgi:hypothetical protein
MIANIHLPSLGSLDGCQHPGQADDTNPHQWCKCTSKYEGLSDPWMPLETVQVKADGQIRHVNLIVKLSSGRSAKKEHERLIKEPDRILTNVR